MWGAIEGIYEVVFFFMTKFFKLIFCGSTVGTGIVVRKKPLEYCTALHCC